MTSITGQWPDHGIISQAYTDYRYCSDWRPNGKISWGLKTSQEEYDVNCKNECNKY